MGVGKKNLEDCWRLGDDQFDSILQVPNTGGLLFNTWRISCKFHEKNWPLRVDFFFLESRAARVILSDPTGQYFFEVFFLSVEMRIKKT